MEKRPPEVIDPIPNLVERRRRGGERAKRESSRSRSTNPDTHPVVGFYAPLAMFEAGVKHVANPVQSYPAFPSFVCSWEWYVV